MKGVKGKLLKKLKTIKPIGYLKPERILQVAAADGYVENFIKATIFKSQAAPVHEETKQSVVHKNNVPLQEPDIIDVAELMKDLEDEVIDFVDEISDDKENAAPNVNEMKRLEEKTDILGKKETEVPKAPKLLSSKTPLSEIDVSSFRRPDLNSSTLFDPNLLAAFERAVMEHSRSLKTEHLSRFNLDEPPSKSRRIQIEDEESIKNPLLEFDEKCPPGGSNSVIFYTTSLRGIRKTFEDCTRVRFLLESFRILYFERDVSMHSEFREELWENLGSKAIPPRLFIKGRYIGGAEEVTRMHEQGRLKPLFEGVERKGFKGPCAGCGGMRFVMCFKCSGSHKLVSEESGKKQLVTVECCECNENGLIVCSLCCL